MGLLKRLLILSFFYGSFAFPSPNHELSRFFEETPSGRIVNGTSAAEGAHPHMVSLVAGLITPSHFCGGSLVSSRSILTAAHCIWPGGGLNTIRGIVGTNRWNLGGQAYPISHGAIHEDYIDPILKNDIAILFTVSDVQFHALVRPIGINFDEFIGGGARTVVAGWGNIRWGGPRPADLQEMHPTTIPGDECVETIQTMMPIAPPVWPEIEVCAFQQADMGICHGDSGSALVGLDSQQQIGIVSWIIPCAFGAPDMYVRISAFKDWIQDRLI